MPLGPLEFLVVKFPGNQFRGEIIPALRELVDTGLIRIADLVFVIKDEVGDVASVEITEVDSDLDDLATHHEDVEGLLTAEDVLDIADLLEPNSSAAMMLFENVWATRFRDAVLNANGELILNERIPQAVVQELLEYAE